MLISLLAICLGAGAGALLRWGASLALNSAFPALSLGTLVVNLAGSYLIGLAAVFFSTHPGLGTAWGLLVITGFLGSLTTFSAFSLEVTLLLQQGQLLPAAGVIAAHVLGCLVMTFLGMGTFHLLRQLL